MKMTPKRAAELAQSVFPQSPEGWREFSDLLFKTQDADPGYMLLHRADVPYSQKLRYVLAWCTFYNPGIAALASQYQGDTFYRFLHKLYPTAKRASERRHFRGAAGLNALNQWQTKWKNPEALVESCFGATYMDVRRNMKNVAQMGDYFYWKLADIQDTVFGHYVDFTGAERYMPKVPKEGAVLLAGIEHPVLGAGLQEIVGTVTDHVKRQKHPFQGRKLALQEAETVCCVYKQHVNGSHHIGFRTAKAVRRLQGVRDQNPALVDKYLDGVWSGGVWTPQAVEAVAKFL